MSILNPYTKDKHREVEAHPLVQHMLSGNMTKEQYATFLQQFVHVYNNVEYFAEISLILNDIRNIKRAELIREDIAELSYSSDAPMLPSTEKYRQHIVELYNNPDTRHLLLAHVYVRHMGDLYGGKVIAKRVPGSGKMYQFEDRPALIKALDAKLDVALVDEALLAFDMSRAIFDELWEKIK